MDFETVLLSDAIRGINAKPNDVRDAIAEMIKWRGTSHFGIFPEPFEAPPAEEVYAELLEEKPLARVDTKTTT